MPIPSAPQQPRLLLRERAYAQIADAIVSGQLEPGEKLNDQELAAWLGISRTPVREALARLEQQGLVSALPGRSTTVSAIDPVTVRESVQVVAALHETATRVAAANLSADDFATMRKANTDFAHALSQSDATAALKADDEFHSVIVKAAGNTTLSNMLEQLMPTLRRAEHSRFGSILGQESADQHSQIIGALERGDADAACAASRENWLTLHLEV